MIADPHHRTWRRWLERRPGSRSARAAITLIELLVVITILALLAALGVRFIPALGEQQRAARGGASLQGWLSAQRHKAVRDQAPRGLRLIVGANNWVSQCQYLEQPDDYSGGQAATLADNQNTVVFAGAADMSYIQPGDHFEFLGMGLMHRIIAVDPTIPAIQLASPVPFKVDPTASYRIVRAPRATSEDLLLLPDDIVLDLNTNSAYGNPLVSMDIIFSPSGQVSTPGFVGETINLWVRDSMATTNPPFEGGPTIVAVHRQTGLVTAHPPAPPPAGPYQYVRDGRSSALD
jgi:hypothetical protein